MPPPEVVYRDAADLAVSDTVLLVGGVSKITEISNSRSGLLLVTFKDGSQTWFHPEDRVPIAEQPV